MRGKIFFRVFVVLVSSYALPSMADGVDPLLAEGGYEGRLRLAATLDSGGNGYCLDVPGPHTNIILRIPAWVHNCHNSPLPDQVYRYNLNNKMRFRFTHQDYDLCLTATDQKPSTRFSYESCGQNSLQTFDVTETGRIMLSGTDLCLVASNMDPDGAEDEVGHGRKVRGDDIIRQLDLQVCGTRPAELEYWVAIDD